MPLSRRDALHRLALGGLAAGALPMLPAVAQAAAVTDHEADLWPANDVTDHAPEQASTFDTTWTKKLTGKYRTVFDVPEIDGAVGVWRAGLWHGHYRDVLKAEAADLNTVIVIRHMGIPLVMNHEFWETYKIGKKSKVRHPGGKGTATLTSATTIWAIDRAVGDVRSLATGHWVRVWFTGPVAMIYPVQGAAAAVVVDSLGTGLTK